MRMDDVCDLGHRDWNPSIEPSSSSNAISDNETDYGWCRCTNSYSDSVKWLKNANHRYLV